MFQVNSANQVVRGGKVFAQESNSASAYAKATLFTRQTAAFGECIAPIGNVAPVEPAKEKAKPRRKNMRCEASNYRWEVRGFYWITEEGKCSCCGKPVKHRTFNSIDFIPAHNVPDAA